MFNGRASLQKPDDAMLAGFRHRFSEVAASPTTTNAQVPSSMTTAAPPIVPSSVTGVERTQTINHPGMFDADPTPRASTNEPWKFTPSLLDPGQFSFPSTFPGNNVSSNFYAQAPGPGGLYPSQPGDMQTPTLGGLSMGLTAPMTMPTSDATLAANGAAPTMLDVNMGGGFPPDGLHPQAFHAYSSFGQPVAPGPYANAGFVQSDGTFATTMDPATGAMNGLHAGVPLGMPSSFGAHPAGTLVFPPGQIPPPPMFAGGSVAASLALLPTPAYAEKFRYHTTLNAPTAMVRHADEIPISYLNKGQAYSISIIDSVPTDKPAPGTRFRTYVRISFEDEQQRQKPGVCWSLWKEGRGSNEAHQRGGKLQAVEYVEAGQPAEGDEKRTRVELESSSFDGFSVLWTPGAQGSVECNIAVRFNFLSTDFSHSKGVKGIPVRLCAKTSRLASPAKAESPSGKEATTSSVSSLSQAEFTEISYCKVKLFRDHGAERKLSNDVAHIKKQIDKVKQQIAQAESGMKDFKRKRSGGAGIVQPKAGADLQRMGKAPKHKRTWSMSSSSSAGNDDGGLSSARAAAASGVRMAVEEDLHSKLQSLQDSFSSTRPVSILYLRGEDLDDPDAHPVVLPGEGGSRSGSTGLAKSESRDNLMAWRDSGRSSVAGSSMVSPSPSSLSLHSHASYQNGGAGGTGGAGGWSDGHGDHLEMGGARSGNGQPTRVARTDDDGNLSGWIMALDVEAGYRPPVSERPKPVACFYVLRRSQPAAESNGDGTHKDLHRAVYLAKRTLREFVARIALKWGLDPSRVVRTVRVLPQGLEVELDDDAVAELPEGQDMLLEVVGASAPAANGIKTESWDMAVDGDSDSVHLSAIELRVSF